MNSCRTCAWVIGTVMEGTEDGSVRTQLVCNPGGKEPAQIADSPCESWLREVGADEPDEVDGWIKF